MDSRRLQRRRSVVVQKRATISKAIVLETTQKPVDPLPIDGRILGGLEQLKPDDIVTEIEEADEVLKQGAPVPTATRIAGQRAVS